MIQKDVLDAVVMVAANWESRSIAATPIENTPVARLSQVIRDLYQYVPVPSVSDVQDKEKAYEEITSSICSASGSTASLNSNLVSAAGATAYATVLDEVTTPAIDGLLRQVKKVRTIVLPVVNDFVERVEQAQASITPSSLGKYEIKYIETPDVMKNTNMFSSLHGMAQAEEADSVIASAGLPMIPDSAIAELLQTGAGAADAELLKWVLSHGSSYLSRIWNEIFVDSRVRENAEFETYSAFKQLVHEPANDLVNCTIIYLLASKLYDSPLPGTNMTLGEFNDKMDFFKNEAGGNLYRKLAARIRAEELGLLVAAVQGTVITVHAGVYQDFVGRGGDNDALFGMILSDKRRSTVSEVLENAPVYRQAWHAKALAIRNENNGARKIHVCQAISEVFRLQLKEAADTETAVRNTHDILDRFNQELSNVEEADLNDLHLLAIRLICRTRFTNDASERILTAMHRIGCENKGIEAREAISLAIFEYLTDWTFSQIKVERC